MNFSKKEPSMITFKDEDDERNIVSDAGKNGVTLCCSVDYNSFETHTYCFLGNLGVTQLPEVVNHTEKTVDLNDFSVNVLIFHR